MRSVAISTDFILAIMIFLFSIVAILEFGNSTFHPPVREAQDIAVTFDTLGVFWGDENTIKNYLDYVDPNASLKMKCYDSNWNLVREFSIYNSNPEKVYWYRMLRYHDGEYCVIDVGVVP